MLSVTMLSSYEYCKRKLFLEKVMGVTEPPKPALLKGSVRHQAYEQMAKQEEAIVTSLTEGMEKQEVLARFREQYLKFLDASIAAYASQLASFSIDSKDIFGVLLPLIETEAQARALVVHSFMLRSEAWGKKLWRLLTPKIDAERRIESGTLELIGIIDQIEVHEDRQVPIELKTGLCTIQGVWPGHKLQIAAYAMLLEEASGKPIDEGIVRYLDSRERRVVAINPYLKKDIRKKVGEVKTLLEGRAVPGFVDNRSKCISCGIREFCYAEDKVAERFSKVRMLQERLAKNRVSQQKLVSLLEK